jgi:IS5 family transposase
LVALKSRIDGKRFRQELNRIHEKDRKSNAGEKPIDIVLIFKILILQHLNNLSDDNTEYQIRDRFSCMHFLNLEFEDRVPDSKTIWF